MKKSVYLDTTIFSFYFDGRSTSVYRRQITKEWWDTQRHYFNLYTSYFTLAEVNNPVYPNWENVSSLAGNVPVLPVSAEIKGIIKIYIENFLMPVDDEGDAAHLAMASFHNIDFLLTWNCAHLANWNKKEHIRIINLRLGLLTPEIITPEQLFREEDYV